MPLWEHEEKEWLDKKRYQGEFKDRERYKDGNLMEFLGDLEESSNKRHEDQREKEGLTVEEQRHKIIISLGPEVQKLRTADRILS